MGTSTRHGRLAILCVPLVAGCGAAGSGAGDMGAGGRDMAAAPKCESDGKQIHLAKKYGIKVTLNVNVKVPSDCAADSCILDKDTASQMLLLADVVQTDAQLTLQSKACRFQVPPVALKNQPQPTVLTAPDALVQSVMVAPSMTALDGPMTCAGFKVPPFALVLGAHLANSGSDPVPVYSGAKNPPVTLCGGKASTACDAAMDYGCVCDLDKDGKPGATVGASGVPAFDDVDQVYLALRTVVGLDVTVWPEQPGQPTPGQRWKGAVSGLKLDQSPVGCHHTPQGGGAPYDCTPGETNSVAQLNPRLSQSVNAASLFVAMPVPDNETCSQLIADAPTLFNGQ